MLDRKTLVLNRSWSPVATTTVRRAIALMARGAAGAVDVSTFELASFERWVARSLCAATGDRTEPTASHYIQAVGFRFPVPDVIVLTTYDGLPKQTVPYTRRNVYRRDAMRCQYCGRGQGNAALTIDHVMPRSRGGVTSWENCVAACLRCNGRKADRTPEEAGLTLARAPFAPTWPGGLEPRTLSERPSWHRFVPKRRLQALLKQAAHEAQWAATGT